MPLAASPFPVLMQYEGREWLALALPACNSESASIEAEILSLLNVKFFKILKERYSLRSMRVVSPS